MIKELSNLIDEKVRKEKLEYLQMKPPFPAPTFFQFDGKWFCYTLEQEEDMAILGFGFVDPENPPMDSENFIPLIKEPVFWHNRITYDTTPGSLSFMRLAEYPLNENLTLAEVADKIIDDMDGFYDSHHEQFLDLIK